MTDRTDQSELQAFADDELPPSRQEEVARAVAANPVLAAQVEQMRQLRLHARTVLRDGKASESLRAAVSSRPLPTMPAATARKFAGLGSWRAIAAGILLLIGVGAIAIMATHGSSLGRLRSGESISSTLVEAAVQQHIHCTAIESHFIVPDFPHVLSGAAASDAAAAYLAPGAAVPDLSSLGYSFVGAGPCQIPGGKTLHALYRSAKGEFISVFLQADVGQVHIEENHAVIARGVTSRHPMVIWRTNGIVHYLIAETFEQLESAGNSLRVPF